MSYSFSVRAATKVDAIEKVSEELTKVVQSQPVHSEDKYHALVAVRSFVNLLADDRDQDVVVSVNGSIWKTDDGVKQVSISVSARVTEVGNNRRV